MLAIPSALHAQFEEHLGNEAVPNGLHGVYKKWLRYYLDFCQKYHSQELLGHSNVRTTVIYTHTIKSRTLKEAKSPLDF